MLSAAKDEAGAWRKEMSPTVAQGGGTRLSKILEGSETSLPHFSILHSPLLPISPSPTPKTSPLLLFSFPSSFHSFIAFSHPLYSQPHELVSTKHHVSLLMHPTVAIFRDEISAGTSHRVTCTPFIDDLNAVV